MIPAGTGNTMRAMPCGTDVLSCPEASLRRPCSLDRLNSRRKAPSPHPGSMNGRQSAGASGQCARTGGSGPLVVSYASSPLCAVRLLPLSGSPEGRLQAGEHEGAVRRSTYGRWLSLPLGEKPSNPSAMLLRKSTGRAAPRPSPYKAIQGSGRRASTAYWTAVSAFTFDQYDR